MLINFDVQKQGKKKILIGCLDWGLGHTTRSMAIIQQLISQSAMVYVAANETQQKILKQQFPELQYLSLSGYNIQYGKTSFGTAFKILLQIPKILKAIKYEHKQVSIWQHQFKFTHIISDNRYGFYATNTHNIFITHQLQIWLKYRFLNACIRWLHYRFLKPFSACWVPDLQGKQNLAGKLSHPISMPKMPVQYIGPLVYQQQNAPNSATTKQVCCLLSGPEPQRSIVEQKLYNIALQMPHLHFIMVRGLPENKQSPPLLATENIEIVPFANRSRLKQIIDASEIVVCRSGYTSIMELTSWNKKMICIPTPGQTEQVYLAQHLANQQQAVTIKQKHLSLPAFKEAYVAAQKLSGTQPFSTTTLAHHIKQLLI